MNNKALLSRQPEAICIRQHADGEKELVGDWPELTELSHGLLKEDTGGVFRFDGQQRLDVVVSEQQRQALPASVTVLDAGHGDVPARGLGGR